MGISIETLALAKKYAKKAAKEEGVNQNFLTGFVTNKTTEEFCESVAEHPDVREGNSFLGAVILTDMPFVGNAECRIDVIHSQTGGFILALELISATEVPYRWYGVYWRNFGGWKALITDTYLVDVYSIDVTESTGGTYAKSYTIKQGNEVISTINIPKDMVVSNGQLVENPTGYPVGKYIELTLANSDNTKIYISVSDLVDVYTVEANASKIQLSIDGSKRISATIVAGSVGNAELSVSVNNAINAASVHISYKTASITGAHGLRYYNGVLQYDDNGTWKALSISDLMI